jgi:hypothetical protein
LGERGSVYGEIGAGVIALNETEVDTLVCSFELTDNSEICKEAWLNGVPMPDRFLEVVK